MRLNRLYEKTEEHLSLHSVLHAPLEKSSAHKLLPRNVPLVTEIKEEHRVPIKDCNKWTVLTILRCLFGDCQGIVVQQCRLALFYFLRQVCFRACGGFEIIPVYEVGVLEFQDCKHFCPVLEGLSYIEAAFRTGLGARRSSGVNAGTSLLQNLVS